MPTPTPRSQPSFLSFPPFARAPGRLHSVIETVQGSRHKIKFDEEKGLFRLNATLPVGSAFPYDFGFVPSTLGEDGDPLDVLVLMDAPTFPGCLVECRLIGVIEATQREKRGKPQRNDRLIAVAAESARYKGVHALDDLHAPVLDEIEHFFIQYNRAANKVFKPIARRGPEAALRLVKKGAERHRAGD